MIIFCQLLFISFFLGTVTSAPNQAPWKSWTFCKKPDPNINNECLLKAVQAVDKDILKGNSYFGTPSFDPLHIEEMSMNQANKDTPVAINITFKDCVITGLGKWQLEEIRADWDGGKLFGKVKIHSPVQFTSQYNINGKVILLPINGQGKSNITFLEGMNVNLRSTIKPFEKKNKKYFKVETFETELQPKGLIFDLENLFGNKALSDNMNKFINENGEEILKDLRKPVSDALGLVFKEIALRVFAKIPIELLIPK